jgi:hypothetical protein
LDERGEVPSVVAELVEQLDNRDPSATAERDEQRQLVQLDQPDEAVGLAHQVVAALRARAWSPLALVAVPLTP